MKILLICNDYYARCYANLISFILPNVDIVYLICDRINNFDKKIFSFINSEQETYDILNCIDTIIVIDDGSISSIYISKIQKMKKPDSKYYSIKINNEEETKTLPSIEIGNSPVVLLLYDGLFTQCCDIEFQLLKAFREQSIKTFFYPSYELYCLLKAIKNDIKREILEVFNNGTDAEINILALNASLLYNKETKIDCIKFIDTIKPDYVAYCVEHNMEINKEFFYFLKYCYSIALDKTIKSNYITYKNALGKRLYIDKCCISSDDISTMMIDNNTGAILYEQILQKLYVPKGIHRVDTNI